MDKKFNDKPSPNQMRILLRRMRGEKYVAESKKESEKNLNMRDMLKITRKLNEQDERTQDVQNKKTVFDQQAEENKFKNFFKDLNVNVKFDELKVFDNLVFWGGIIDGIIVFTYSVTPDERTSKVTFDYLPDFSPDNPENDEIIKRVKAYYDTFYEYWKDNVVQQ
jgi:hypothetical protein